MIAQTSDAIVLNSYLVRIGYDPASSEGKIPPASIESLKQIHLAHATHVPFENLDVLLKRPIKLDLESIQRKIVTDSRGGWCFEQNALLAAALEQVGFEVTRLSGRVRYYTERVLPRTHMVLKVEAEGESWLADVGFGGISLLEPIRLIPDLETKQGSWKLRLKKEG